MDSLTPVTLSKTEALAARYGTAEIPPAGPWNPIIASLLDHRSVRGYRPDAPPEGTLETLVAAASSAATSSNLQTWSVISVRDPAKLAVLAEIAGGQKHIQQCPIFLVWLADVSRNERLGQDEGTVLEGMPYLETFLVAAIDAALASQNAVVAAESLGLSTVYIGALRNDVVRVAETLGLPPGVVGVFGLCVGYAADAAKAEVKPRLPQATVLHHDTYDHGAEPAQRAAYDVLMNDFSRRNEMAADTWTARVINRIGTMKALRGRDRLSAAIRSLGFPLR
ncbi:NADPH-dependent oxidoreductase [Paeniroseomonas aquatica]|uniref:NADPH-dependent oxidoreductase n=1 Tax=Paeniroseomonas aquatica TaxID=373043 RepID=A0ABT8AAH5_9PROT|nr:NADPH-dependent oxidoreductase [Paeniroseomonas aquatica]MDN3566324.1 NADPH-dependent oxidoreductase [Paeniroseomonas aquatica]